VLWRDATFDQEVTMAKKKQSKSKPKSGKVRSRQSASHPFMAARPGDLSALLAAADKGPRRDQAGSRFVAPASGSGTTKPGSRED
jgi:hypothetical protein